jgi:hypothetical protein
MKTERVFMKPGKTNEEDRMNFVKFWADYVRTHRDEEWSEQQNIIIDSQINPPISPQISLTGQFRDSLSDVKSGKIKKVA